MTFFSLQYSVIVFLVYLLTSCLAAASPPTLSVPPVYVSNATNELTIQCTGEKPLQWEVVQVKNTDYSINNTQHGNQYISIFTINETIRQDTGYFNCCYIEDGTSCGDQPQNTAFSYIYIGEPGFSFVKGSSTLQHLNIGQLIELDCRTTHPDIIVTVFKNSVDITNHFNIEPFYRFSTIAKSLQDSGVYECRDSLFGGKLRLHVKVFPEAPRLHNPVIKEKLNSYHIVGLELNLNCSIPYSEDGIQLSWILPNPNTSYEISNFSTDESVPTEISSLKISSPSSTDSGNFVCIARQRSREKSTNMTVIFKEELESFVKFVNEDDRPTLISVEQNETCQWISEVRVYPANPSFVFYDPFDNIIQDSSRVAIDFDYPSGLLTLRIFHVSHSDFGKYTVNVTTADGKSDQQMAFIFVIAPPKVELSEPPPFYHIGQNVTLFGNILSFVIGSPRPNVTWWFNECKNYESCSNTNQTLEHNLESAAGGPRNRWLSNITFPATSSGYVFCKAENKNGQSFSSKLIVASDIKGNFVMRLSSEIGDQDIYSSNTAIDIIDGDQIKILCAGLKFFYTDVSLKAGNSSSKFISDCSTNYSNAKCFNNFNVSKNYSGEYMCRGRKISTAELEKLSLQLIVLDKATPTLVETLSNVSVSGMDLSVKVEDAFRLSCVVKGRPEPRIVWFKDSAPVESIEDFIDSESVILHTRNTTLEFKFMRSEYGGKYTCSAESRAGKMEAYANVIVNEDKSKLVIVIIVSVVFMLVLVSCSSFLICKIRRERKSHKELRQNHLDLLFEKGNVGNLNSDCMLDEQAELLPYDNEYEIERRRIHLGKLLGSGAFGRVVLAEIDDLKEPGTRTKVAVKSCKDMVDSSQLRGLILELKIMIHLGKDLNIVNLLGAYTVNIEKGELWLIVEYCKYGNLLKYLQKNKNRFVNQIDSESGSIDRSRLTPPFGRISPSAYSLSSQSRHPSVSNAPTLDKVGYVLSRSRSPSSPTTPTYPVQSDPIQDSCHSRAFPFSHVENPQYLGFQNDAAIAPHQLPRSMPMTIKNPSPPPYVASSRIPYGMPEGHSFCQSSSQSSDGGSAFRTLNTDMTRITTPGPPISPTGEIFYDSYGNSFTFTDGEMKQLTSMPFNTDVLINWAWQIARGMEYLVSRKVMHGDLAARNILLCEDNVVKISDFGFSRDIKYNIYKKKDDGAMPIKWMSLEAIKERIFSTQSDVWAYGVTLWEIFTLGSTPYPLMPVDKNFVLELENGTRMEKPKYCNSQLYEIMLKCWRQNPLDRPSFTNICNELLPWMNPSAEQHYISMNEIFKTQNERWFESRTDYINLMPSPDFSKFQAPSQEIAGYIDMQDGSCKYLPMHYIATPSTGAPFSPARSSTSEGNVFKFDEELIPPPIVQCSQIPLENTVPIFNQTNNNNNNDQKHRNGTDTPPDEEPIQQSPEFTNPPFPESVSNRQMTDSPSRGHRISLKQFNKVVNVPQSQSPYVTAHVL